MNTQSLKSRTAQVLFNCNELTSDEVLKVLSHLPEGEFTKGSEPDNFTSDFNHDENDVYKACNLTKRDLVELGIYLSELHQGDEFTKTSQVIEQVLKNYNFDYNNKFHRLMILIAYEDFKSDMRGEKKKKRSSDTDEDKIEKLQEQLALAKFLIEEGGDAISEKDKEVFEQLKKLSDEVIKREKDKSSSSDDLQDLLKGLKAVQVVIEDGKIKKIGDIDISNPDNITPEQLSKLKVIYEKLLKFRGK